MKIIYRWLLAAILATAPTLAAAHNELAREPRGIDTPVPANSPPPPVSSAQKITVYTAKAIVTLDPATPSAQAVAAMNGKILGVGTLDEVRGWVTNQEFEIDRRFQNAVIVPGFIEAHMHPQFTGVLWQGVYVGRFDRTSPEGTQIKGLETKEPSSNGSETSRQKYRLMDDGWSPGAISRNSTTTRRSPAPISTRFQMGTRSSSKIFRCIFIM